MQTPDSNRIRTVQYGSPLLDPVGLQQSLCVRVHHLHIYTPKACAEPGRVYTTEECAASGRVYIMVSCAAPEGVRTTEACTAPGDVYTTGA